MDVLDKLIYLARLRGRIDVCCRLGGGFHLEHKTEPETARLHWVVSGSGWLQVGNGQAVALSTGDAVLLPPTPLPATTGAEFLAAEHAVNKAAAVAKVKMERSFIELPFSR